MDSDPGFIFDGKWLSPPYEGFPVLNRAFRFGDGCFESIRVYEGKALFWQHHLARLERGMAALGLQADLPALRLALGQGFCAWRSRWPGGAHGALRIEVFRQGAGRYTPENDGIHWVMEGRLAEKNSYEKPTLLNLGVFTGFDWTPGPFAGLKLCNALPYVLAGRAAQQQGLDDLLLSHGGNVVEASASNVFFVKENTLITPSLASGCLDGVLRGEMLRLAAEEGIPTEERLVGLEELSEMKEVFLTNVIRGVMVVNQWPDRRKVHLAPGPVSLTLFQRLLRRAATGLASIDHFGYDESGSKGIN